MVNRSVVIQALRYAGLPAQEGRDNHAIAIRGYGYLDLRVDDGSTGTCRKITKRAGTIAGILRGLREEVAQ